MESPVEIADAPTHQPHQARAAHVEDHWAGGLVTVSVVRYPHAVHIARSEAASAGFTLVLRGRYADTFESRRFEYQPLSAVFHPEGLSYGREIGHGGADVVTFELGPRMLGGLARSRAGIGAVRDLSGSPLVWTLLSAYAHLPQAERHPLVIEEPVAEVLHALAAGRQRGPLQEPPWMARVRRLIETRFRDPLSLARCASVAGVQPVYLARVYRRVFGQSLRDTVQRLRTVAACRLIQHGRFTLAEIAEQTGFDNESQLAAACHGMTSPLRDDMRRALAVPLPAAPGRARPPAAPPLTDAPR
jgi:AraC family transcriptional regulator